MAAESDGESDEDLFGGFKPIADAEVVFRPKRLKELNQYYVGCVLGKGSFGKVKEAVDKVARKMVSIKIMKERMLLKTPGGIDAVHREIELWTALDHPCVVHMIEHFTIESKGKIYIVMEYVDCGNLHDLVLRAPAKKLPIPQARRFFRDLLDGVQYIHSLGIIHKDVKPANCLISSNATLKICDFGVAERKSDIPLARRASTVIAVGSPAFQPPEIASGEEKVPDFYVDIWAVGITLFFMVCGQYPFHGDTVLSLLENIANCQWTLPDDIDPGTRHLIASILTVNKADRLDLEKIKNHEWTNMDDSEYLGKRSSKSHGKNSSKSKLREKSDLSKTDHTIAIPWVELMPSPSMFERDSKGLVKMDLIEDKLDNDGDDVDDFGDLRKSNSSCCTIC